MTMSMALVLASALAAQAPVSGDVAVEVAYSEMRDGRSVAAIRKIEGADARDADHPARLINLGIAHGRMGESDKARALFDAAAAEGPFWLETATGEWIDSRELARKAIAMLERGEFAAARFASR
jgi:hypothetical protein